MKLKGTQSNVLMAVAFFQERVSNDRVEDSQLAELLDLNLNFVQETLNTLAEAGYVQVETVETLSSKKYMASLTAKGEAALEVFV